MKVLVINDERATADSLAEILHRNGHHVLPLYDAVEAMDLAEHLTFDVALIARKLGQSFLDLGDGLQKMMPRCNIIFVLDPGIIWFAQGLLKHGLVKEFEYLPESFKTQRSLHQIETVFSDSPEQF